MLLYPLVNLTVILPLSVYRLLGLTGKQGSPQALAICGCIFSLGGFANVLLYSFSRVSHIATDQHCPCYVILMHLVLTAHLSGCARAVTFWRC